MPTSLNGATTGDAPLLSVRGLTVRYRTRAGELEAVSDVSFDLAGGEALGLVGESGCGKSSVALAIAQLPPPASGEVLLDGVDVTKLARKPLRRARRAMPLVFQDPRSSLNPRRRVADAVAQALPRADRQDGATRRRIVEDLLGSVGMDPGQGQRYPHELSGGQCQRVSIARALATSPRVLLCDEPVSSLDVSVQAQVLRLLAKIQAEKHLSLLFISHDLSVVRAISDRVAVMYLGRLCEVAETETLFATPAHPYTAALIDAVPAIDADRDPAERRGLAGEVPSPMDPPSGCRFRTRCPLAQAVCATETPRLEQIARGHWVACHFPLQAGDGPGTATGAQQTDRPSEHTRE